MDNDSFFMSPAVEETDLEDTSLTVKTGLGSPLEGRVTYYWRAAAYTETWGTWSETRSFYNLRPNNP